MDDDVDKVKYVTLEPMAWLADEDWNVMSCCQRGLWWMITLQLYANQGKWRYDVDRIKSLANYGGQSFENDLEIVLLKFQVRRGFIYHKRVSKEMKAAQARQRAGVTAAQARWEKERKRKATAMPSHSDSNAPIGNANQSSNKSNKTKPLNQGISSQQFLIFDKDRERYKLRLQEILSPFTPKERNVFNKILRWLTDTGKEGKLDIFTEAIALLRKTQEALQKPQEEKPKNPKAYYIGMLKKELGYS